MLIKMDLQSENEIEKKILELLRLSCPEIGERDVELHMRFLQLVIELQRRAVKIAAKPPVEITTKK